MPPSVRKVTVVCPAVPSLGSGEAALVVLSSRSRVKAWMSCLLSVSGSSWATSSTRLYGRAVGDSSKKNWSLSSTQGELRGMMGGVVTLFPLLCFPQRC